MRLPAFGWPLEHASGGDEGPGFGGTITGFPPEFTPTPKISLILGVGVKYKHEVTCHYAINRKIFKPS